MKEPLCGGDHEYRALDRASVVGRLLQRHRFGKICCYNSALWNETRPQVPWFSAVPQDLFVFFGICGFLEAWA